MADTSLPAECLSRTPSLANPFEDTKHAPELRLLNDRALAAPLRRSSNAKKLKGSEHHGTRSLGCVAALPAERNL